MTEVKPQFLTLDTQRAKAIELLVKLNPFLTAMHAVEILDKMLSLNAYNLMHDRLKRIQLRTMHLLFGYKSRSDFLVKATFAIDELIKFVTEQGSFPIISKHYYEGASLTKYRTQLELRYKQFLLYEKVKSNCKDNIITYFNFCKYHDPKLYENINDQTLYKCKTITLNTPQQFSGRFAYDAYTTEYNIPIPATTNKGGTRRRRNTRRRKTRRSRRS